MNKFSDKDKIMSDKNLFYNSIYTKLSDAINILEKRSKNQELKTKVENFLEGNIPNVLKENPNCAVQFRQIATPNHDTRHFLSICEEFGLTPVFFEYLDDKFTSNNEFKHSLAQLRLQKGVNKNDEFHIEKVTIVDFNQHTGKKMKEVTTTWDESLIDFHHRLFNVCELSTQSACFYDASKWFKENGNQAIDYYTNFLMLFVCHGILFENFLMENTEGEFSKEVVLPALEKIEEITGEKPLIVPIPPMDIEMDTHWISYNHPEVKSIIPNN